MAYDPMRLARLFRRHREAARLTQQELARKSGISDKKISRIEQGFVQDPGFGDVIPIGVALGLTPNQIAADIGLYQGESSEKAKDERWDWVLSFMQRAGPQTLERFYDMAYSAAITADRLSAAPESPKRLRKDTSRIPV
jgi:transcriptional regulator with XRE-family HTH domain